MFGHYASGQTGRHHGEYQLDHDGRQYLRAPKEEIEQSAETAVSGKLKWLRRPFQPFPHRTQSEFSNRQIDGNVLGKAGHHIEDGPDDT